MQFKARRESVQEDTRFTGSREADDVFGNDKEFPVQGSGDQRPESLSSLLELLELQLELLLVLD